MTNPEARLGDLVTVKEFVNKRTGFPIAAGILTIIAACACLIVGIIGLIVFFLFLARQLLIQGVIAVLAFAFGLTSRIMSLKRRHFAMTRLGFVSSQLLDLSTFWYLAYLWDSAAQVQSTIS